ncbi:hypothetical protein LIER_35406 [Lithospermum erythrorhizon]|uniref:VQ domain-containing protein n=1 Tax=Lithospermum erythrorhizon TaxID=34254 RepID=A0AAV3NRP4_LITER
MEVNSTPSSSFSSSSDSTTKISSKSFLQPSRVIQKKSSTVTKIMKHHIAPLPKLPPKIYKVEPKDFKKVVQELTGPQPEGDQPIRRLKDLAPPPLNLSPIVPSPAETIFISDDENDTELMGQVEFDSEIDEYFKNLETLIKISPKLMTPSCGSTSLGGLLSPLVTPAFRLSPASLSWCSLFLSPGTLSTLDQSILLGP